MALALTACTRQTPCPACPCPLSHSVDNKERAPLPPVNPSAAPPTRSPAPLGQQGVNGSRASNPDSPCWAKGRPSPRQPPKTPPPQEYCRDLDAGEVARVESRLRRKFAPLPRTDKLIIDFGCDQTDSYWKEVFYEDGSGHGQSLQIVRFRYESTGLTVRMIDAVQFGPPRIDIRTATIPADPFASSIPGSRVALLSRAHLIHLSFQPGSLEAYSMSASSYDFHSRLSIMDHNGYWLDRHFTGYAEDGTREASFPMIVATEAISTLLNKTQLRTEAPTEEDRAMFTERFLVTMSEDPVWWVAERYLFIAAQLGTVDALPALALAAQAKGSGNPSDVRRQEGAILALAAISGWDPRIGPNGQQRTLDQTAAAIQQACIGP